MATPVCWKCGASLGTVPQPMSRRAQCPACEAELHVCRMCAFWNPRISDRCEEPRAEHPRRDDTANFCDYLKLRPDAYVRPGMTREGGARAGLDALFGGSGDAPASPARDRLNDLFGVSDKKK